MQNHPNYTNRFQSWIDNETIPRYTEGATTAELENKHIWFFTQVGNIGSGLREPYLSEVWFNVNLALSFGAKGISYFLYPTNPGGATNLTGLVKNRYDPNPYDPITTNPYGQNPWENIIDLNSYLKTIGPTLLKLDRMNTFTGITIPAGNGVLSTINNAAYPEYIQIGLFTHQETNENYLFLVNRMCREPTPDGSVTDDDTQSFDVELFNSGSIRVIEDIYASRTPNNTNAFVTLDPGENSFAVTLKPGEGKLFRIVEGGLSGDIPEEEYYLSGNIYVNGDLVVPDGYKLAVEPQTTIEVAPLEDSDNRGNYPNLSELIVFDNAKLMINNATITSASPGQQDPNQWGGIQFHFTIEGSDRLDVNISNSTIQNATTALLFQSDPTWDHKNYWISQNNIDNCGVGIQIINYQNEDSLDIQCNQIQNCDIGIELLNSNCAVQYNTIQNCDFGIVCNEASHPVIRGNTIYEITNTALYCLNNSNPYVQLNMDDPYHSAGENQFYFCGNGVLAENNSYPQLGEYSEDHLSDGANYIYGNTVEIYNANKEQEMPVYAIYNYWGNIPGTSPPPGTIVGNVEYEPWLTIPEGEMGQPLSGPTTSSPEWQAYLAAVQEEENGNLPAAYSAYQGIISNYANHAVTKLTLSGIIRILEKQNHRNQIISELNQIIQNYSGYLVSDIARHQIVPYLVENDDYNTAIDHSNNLLTNYTGTDFEPYILLDQLYIAESQQNFGGGSGFSKTIGNEISPDLAVVISEKNNPSLNRYLSLKLNRIKQAKSDPVVTKNCLSPNYPNPFNPVTTIEYHLISPGHTKLEIYNLLGQKVRRLVNLFEETGFHSVKWDAKDEYGKPVASGVYIYRLYAGERFVQNRKMLLIK